MEGVYRQLQDHFGLNTNHIQILETLEHSNLEAKNLCEKTKIPRGRIYEYLNFLVEKGIIEKSKQRPYKYSITHLEQSIMSFTKHKIDSMVKIQSEIIDLMQEHSEQVEMFKNNKQYTETHLAMLVEGKSFKYTSPHLSFPYTLYPYDYELFVKLRKAIISSRPTTTFSGTDVIFLIYKTYLDAFKEGKVVTGILEKASFDRNIKIIKSLGKPFFDKWKKTVLEQFKKYGLKTYVLDEYIPHQIDINEKRATVALRFHGVTSGISMRSKDAVKFYDRVFEQNLKRAKDVVPMIKKLKY
tara:strand:- start:709 stop:1602 length:894 start_codon:yes stop_codon:yes gene_type:complete